jgi:hypothetical protein
MVTLGLAPPNQLFSSTRPDSIVALQARWDYAELYDWMEYLTGGIGGGWGAGVNSSGIDASHDRILFGIEKRESLPAVVSSLVGKGIPCGLVAVEVIGPIRMLSRPASRTDVMPRPSFIRG